MKVVFAFLAIFVAFQAISATAGGEDKNFIEIIEDLKKIIQEIIASITKILGEINIAGILEEITVRLEALAEGIRRLGHDLLVEIGRIVGEAVGLDPAKLEECAQAAQEEARAVIEEATAGVQQCLSEAQAGLGAVTQPAQEVLQELIVLKNDLLQLVGDCLAENILQAVSCIEAGVQDAVDKLAAIAKEVPSIAAEVEGRAADLVLSAALCVGQVAVHADEEGKAILQRLQVCLAPSSQLGELSI